MSEPGLQHKTKSIRHLISEYREGRLVIPEFQRDYVWKEGRAPTLLDSLYRGWPISSLLVWENEDEHVERRRSEPRAVRNATRWLIDGQQRLITLHKIATGDEGIEVVFHSQEEKFRRPNAATRQDPDWIPVTAIWNDDDYRSLTRALPEDVRGRRTQERYERVRKILEYEVPIVEMVDHRFKDAVEAFKRINTLGYRLRAADIKSAEVAAKHTGFIRKSVAPFVKKLHNQGFTRVTVMHLFRACAFVAHPDGRNRTPLHELERKQVQDAWDDTERATEEALRIVRSEFGLVDMSVLWSGALLIPIIAVCARVRRPNAKELAGWMALAALHHRYSGASDTAIDEDLKACRSDDPIAALLKNLRPRDKKLRATPDHFAGKLADRNALFAAWVACKFKGARDLLDEGAVVLQPNIDRHHILPRGRFEQSERALADAIANIAFISGRSNRSLGDEAPEQYLAKIKQDVLKSQCVPRDRALWSVKSAERFWEARRAELAAAFNEFLDKQLPDRQLGR